MRRSGQTRRAAAAVATVLLATGMGGCMENRGLPFIADVPESTRPAPPPGVYPNINDNPERPSDLKTAEELQAAEEELERLGTSHVGGAQHSIQAGGSDS